MVSEYLLVALYLLDTILGSEQLTLYISNILLLVKACFSDFEENCMKIMLHIQDCASLTVALLIKFIYIILYI